VDAQDGLRTMGDLYDTIKNAEKERINLMINAGNLSDIAVERGNNLASINQKIAQLTADESLQRQILQDEFDNEINLLRRQKNISDEIVNNLIQQNRIATQFSTLTENQKQQLEAQLEAYNSIKLAIGGILDTASLLTSGSSGMFGMSLIGAGVFVDRLGEIRSELGGIVGVGTTFVSFFDQNAVDNIKELSNQFGGIDKVTTELQLSTSLISKNMGITGAESAQLIGYFSRINNNSEETALNLIKSTQEFAKQNGLIPSQLLSDLAQSAQEFALYGKDGGRNMIEAAAAAKKMGVNLSSLAVVTESLLDFESSMTKELELGAMLGRNINLDRARSLAYQGDIAGATKETLDAVGGIDAFNKMDYFQKKATAELLGVQVDELQKMVTTQENLTTIGGQLNEKFSILGETVNAGLNKYLGTSLKAMGGMVMTGAQLGGAFAQMGVDIKGIASRIPVLGKLFQPTVSAPSQNRPTPSGNIGQSGGLLDSMKSIKMGEVLKGAAALLVVAGAVFVFGKAVQEFSNVSWESVGMAVVSMLSLVGAISLLGLTMSSGVGTVAILAGAGAMLIIASSVLVLGHALQSIGTGFEMLSNGVSTLVPNLTQIGVVLTGMITFIPAIAALSLALMGLSAALSAVGVASTIALPSLIAVSAIGTIASGVNSIIGDGGEKTNGNDDLIGELRALRDDLKSGKVAVYMDGKLVTAKIANIAGSVSSNSYGSQ
jgi:hypothetical protein